MSSAGDPACAGGAGRRSPCLPAASAIASSGGAASAAAATVISSAPSVSSSPSVSDQPASVCFGPTNSTAAGAPSPEATTCRVVLEHGDQVQRAVPPALPPRPPPRPRPAVSSTVSGQCSAGSSSVVAVDVADARAGACAGAGAGAGTCAGAGAGANGSGGGGGGGVGVGSCGGSGGCGAGPSAPVDAIVAAAGPSPAGAVTNAAALDALDELSPAPANSVSPNSAALVAAATHAAHLSARKPPVLRRACWLRKYVFLCTACGGLAVLLGALFLTVYFMLRSYTSSLAYFETVPTYVPAAMLIGTGLVVMCLAGRRNRYAYLIKLCGGCCLACAVLCVVVTITTTVVHMNRLQTLRECIYTQKTQTCTCYSALHEPASPDRTDEGVRYVFNATPDCEVVHGALYSCLRAMFGLSVIGILICIFSCMLVYQLLSHEKKKMYWEQLEMRCRYLYRQQRAVPATHHCACCEECRFPPTAPPELFPWEAMDDRYWSGPARVGNLYSPNPGEEVTTSASAGCGAGNSNAPHRSSSGWSWRRLPWSRGGGGGAGPGAGAAIAAAANASNGTSGEGSQAAGFRNATGSPDSQYGFSSRPALVGSSRSAPTIAAAVSSASAPGTNTDSADTASHHALYGGSREGRVTVGPQTQSGSQGPPQPGHRSTAFMTESSMAAIHIEGYPPPGGGIPVVGSVPAGQSASQQRYYMWGPPPPYSNPNSPARSVNTASGSGGQPLLNILAASTQNVQGGSQPQGTVVAAAGTVSPRYHHFQHHHHLHHHHHHCQLQAQQLQTQATPVLSQGEVLLEGSTLLKHLQEQQRNRTCPQGDVRHFPETSSHCFEDISSSSGDVASAEFKNTSASAENYMNTSEAELASGDISENNTDSSSSKDNISNTLPARKPKKRLDISSIKSVSNIPYSLGLSTSGVYQSSGSVQGIFSSGQHESKMSIEEEYNSEDRNGNPTNSHPHYIAGIANTAFQDQEGQASSKSDQTESEVYFADVSSCCNVSVRNDGQDSSLYDEAVDPQKRLMILNRDNHGRVTSISSGGQYPGHHHDHHALHQQLLGSENTVINCVGAEDTPVTTGCFTYTRQGSCNRMPYSLMRHPVESVNDRMCSQACNRDYLSQVTKDPSVSSGNGTPMTETASPMSISTSSPSPGSYPPEGIVNCVTFYREGTIIVGEKDSLCSGTDMYPPIHKSIQQGQQHQQPLLQQQQQQQQQQQPQQQQQQRNLEFSDNHFLAPDAQYETISSPPQQFPCHLQKVFSGREDMNGNTPPNSPGRSKLMTSSPRRHLNLPLHISAGGTTNNSNIIENIYHTATSTEEEETDHQQQYSDATMDSGCHSGSEFATHHHRAPSSGTTGNAGTKLSVEDDEQQSSSSNIQVTNMRNHSKNIYCQPNCY